LAIVPIHATSGPRMRMSRVLSTYPADTHPQYLSCWACRLRWRKPWSPWGALRATVCKWWGLRFAIHSYHGAIYESLALVSHICGYPRFEVLVTPSPVHEYSAAKALMAYKKEAFTLVRLSLELCWIISQFRMPGHKCICTFVTMSLFASTLGEFKVVE